MWTPPLSSLFSETMAKDKGYTLLKVFPFIGIEARLYCKASNSGPMYCATLHNIVIVNFLLPEKAESILLYPRLPK